MKIAISAGHSSKVRGASGSPIPPYLDEYDENVRVVNQVYSDLQAAGVTVVKFIDTTSTSQNENLHRIVNWHNSQDRDLDISVHFNASSPQSTSYIGNEVLYVSNTGYDWATKVSAAIANVAGWPNRGAKKRTDLYFLNNTNKPAILIETCFVTSSADGNTYRTKFNDICAAIAQTVGGEAVPVPPEPEPGPEPEVPTVDIKTTGNVVITVNGQQIGTPTSDIPSYQTDIIATVFNGTGANGAYGIPIPPANSSAKYLALPWKDQALKNKNVRVYNRETGRDDVGEIWDLGPWFIDDNYPSLMARPLAEQCYLAGKPCPRGPNQGVVPNGAGIDLSPALASSIGISGKGKVDWKFI